MTTLDPVTHARPNPALAAGLFLVDLVWVAVKTVLLLIGLLVGLPILLVPAILIGTVLLLANVLGFPFGGLYRHVLTQRYIKHKLIPIIAMAAVVLCTSMVITVISIMGGFLDLVKNAGHTVMGDVSIHGGLVGFPHYQELIDEILKQPEAEAASPIIVAYGLLNLPGGVVKPVQVYGIIGEGQDKVTKYRSTLYWTKERLTHHSHVAERFRNGELDPVPPAIAMVPPWAGAVKEKLPAMVMGIEVNPYNMRMHDGSYQFPEPSVGEPLNLTLVPVTTRGGLLEPKTQQFIVINEFNSGVYDVDSQRVFIPFAEAQRMMQMTEAAKVVKGPDGRPIIENGKIKTSGVEPARATEIHIKAAKGVSDDMLRAAVVKVYDKLSDKYRDLPYRPAMQIQTWQQRQARFIQAVENEKGLVTGLFAFISVVAVLLIGVMFYMIVLEKTRDIGILRAVGASQLGVMFIFISFGAIIGILGAAIGTLMAWLLVTNINEVHSWMGDGLGSSAFVLVCGLVGGFIGVIYFIIAGAMSLLGSRKAGRSIGKRTLWLCGGGGLLGGLAGLAIVLSNHGFASRLNLKYGIVMWDRSVYFFDRIPSRVNWNEVAVIVLVAIIASIVGALVAAVKAALVDPIESLRYE
jgi:lipoprotein-releasing system permease protein